jgi:hypothetical protein
LAGVPPTQGSDLGGEYKMRRIVSYLLLLFIGAFLIGCSATPDPGAGSPSNSGGSTSSLKKDELIGKWKLVKSVRDGVAQDMVADSLDELEFFAGGKCIAGGQLTTWERIDDSRVSINYIGNQVYGVSFDGAEMSLYSDAIKLTRTYQRQ